MNRHPEQSLKEQAYTALSIRLDEYGSGTDNRGYYITVTDQVGEQSIIRLKVDELRTLAAWIMTQGDKL